MIKKKTAKKTKPTHSTEIRRQALAALALSKQLTGKLTDLGQMADTSSRRELAEAIKVLRTIARARLNDDSHVAGMPQHLRDAGDASRARQMRGLARGALKRLTGSPT